MSPRVNSWSISRGVLPLGLLMCRIFDYCAAEMLGRIISRLASVKLRYFCRHKQQLKDWYARLFKLMASSLKEAEDNRLLVNDGTPNLEGTEKTFWLGVVKTSQ
ncbi:hypothetical protein FOXG_09642 [Fusarium oxysporum f. sp. lycopersici 4287]|uniref:Uncharacterized protein n=2 Tax=Fusarium oxysporum TaxID=5507 RepID=A0A0J9VBY1_FUSO4|nr:hypothetical protein FOXG_09642 [Fusarium oxysporum f. sp. lycopersici 4287]KNB08959.1 hypothetical protein FOXG_09642 [Fusarium oxysporum f. sp. lycopersici 4287]